MSSNSDQPTQPRDYGLINVVWSAVIAGLLAITKDRHRDAPPATELPVLGLATFALTKAVSKEKVGRWVRSAVVDGGGEGEQPKGRGVRLVVGELLTCPRCLGAWTSVAIIGLRVISPREGRIVASVLATSAINDGLQASFSYLCAKCNAAKSDARAGDLEARAAEVRFGDRQKARANGG